MLGKPLVLLLKNDKISVMSNKCLYIPIPLNFSRQIRLTGSIDTVKGVRISKKKASK